jgi:hypothetical protein
LCFTARYIHAFIVKILVERRFKSFLQANSNGISRITISTILKAII